MLDLPSYLADSENGRLKGLNLRVCAIVIALAAAAQIVSFGYLVARTEIQSPISDGFAYIDDYLQFRAGKVSLLEYLWQAHGEHHLVWIRLLTWVDVAIFHVRAIPFSIAATAAISATAILIWNELRRAEPKLGAATGLGLLGPMVILSAANATDCSVPINTTYTFTVFFAVLSLVLFGCAERPQAKVAIFRICGIMAALASSLGTAAGLLMWPILLWWAVRRRFTWPWIAVVASLGGGYCVFYLRGLQFLGLGPLYEGGIRSFLSVPHLEKLADYFLVFLGLPFTRDPRLEVLGRLVGAMLLFAGAAAALVASFSWRLNTRLDRIGVGMILFAIGAAILATVGRADMSEKVEIPVRYAIFSTMLQAALLCIILPRSVRFASWTGELVSGLGLALSMGLLIVQIFIARAALTIADSISREADCFAEGALRGAASPVVTRWPEDADRVLAELRRLKLLAPRTNTCASPITFPTAK